MQLTSFSFLVFFPLVVAGYFALPNAWRWFWLLIASSYFYSFFIPVYFLILVLVIIVDYIAALLIEPSRAWRRKCWLLASITTNLVLLIVFKYYNFIDGNLVNIAKFIGWNFPIKYLSIALPVGLSFHTFQAMSYTIEVYRGHQKAERHLGIYALYVMFFPQLVAGPIERPQNLLHQFYENHRFDYDRVVSGLRLMAWGFFKKVVVADRLAQVINPIYLDPADFCGPLLTIATVFFAFQVYYDFSGYSDIAVGSARVMGFRLMNNFNCPYYAHNIPEFWRRWHISLSTWFRDYLYIPLGGNRVSRARWYANIFIVFLVSGLWHGANWTYFLWGMLHGCYFIVGSLTERIHRRVASALSLIHCTLFYRLLQILCTFVLIDAGWVLFRASSISDVLLIVAHLGMNWNYHNIVKGLHDLNPNISVLLHECLIAIGALFAIEGWYLVKQLRQASIRITAWPWWLRWSAYYSLVTAIFATPSSDHLQFIYFQF